MIKIQFSKRIKYIANEVKYDTLADIGTDHAYIPIHCCKTKDMKKVIACDMNPSPLSRATNNITHYNLSSKIQTRLCNGLKGIEIGEVESVTIGGMGGFLIIDILNDAIDVVKNLKQLILQPQQDINEVRKYLHKIGFKISGEKMLIEDSKFYNILICEVGVETQYAKKEYEFGKILIDEKNNILKQFIEIKLEKMQKIKNQINKKSNSNYDDSLQKLYEEVLKCL